MMYEASDGNTLQSVNPDNKKEIIGTRKLLIDEKFKINQLIINNHFVSKYSRPLTHTGLIII